jgi:MoaA/NifB/PqqE/SkfB family radical SAM enzyme
MALTVIRSLVPDLLFEDTQDQRLEELAPLLRRPEALGPATPLDRITVFVTARCNLACAYCKAAARGGAARKPGPGAPDTFDLRAFERLLDAHAGTPIRHLHFTGGEASLVRALPAMVRAARARGVQRTSLTSNGTLPPERYLALADAGLDELRVSLDAADRARGDAIRPAARPSTGSRRAAAMPSTGAWEAAVETLDTLAHARRTGVRLFLIVNTVVTRANRRDLPATLRFFLRFGPDDLKLITEVDGRDDLGDFPEAPRVRAELEALLAELPAGSFPLLRRKLRTVFAPTAIGLDALQRPGRPWRCFIPLTERTVDTGAYYPCSIYVREGGAPLGRLTDPPELQRARTVSFVREADCLADPICRRYCLHCTRTFNARANEVAG